jgi:hypothetical protein
MKKSKWMSLLCAVLLIAAQGCSSDDTDGDFDPGAEAAEAAVGAVTTGVVQPILGFLNILQTFIPTPVAPPPGFCTQVGCDSGFGEICPITAAEVMVSMDQCQIGASTITGTVNLTLIPPTSALAVMSVNVDGVQLDGTMVLEASGTCVESALTSFSAGTGTTSAFMDGLLTVCGGGFPTAGSALFIMASVQNAGDFEMNMAFDGTSTAMVVLADASSGMLLATCNVDLITGDANCSSAG